jgi:hypothetical protein
MRYASDEIQLTPESIAQEAREMSGGAAGPSTSRRSSAHRPQNAIIVARDQRRPRRKDKPVFAVRSHFCRLLARERSVQADMREQAGERAKRSGAGVIYAKSLMLAKQRGPGYTLLVRRPSWAPLVSPGPPTD